MTGFKEWLAKVEQKNTPHIARGAVMGLGFWVFGIRVWNAGLSPFLFSFAAMFLFSLLWEIYDELRMVKYGAARYDGFDWMDIVCDLTGVAIGQFWHLATHAYD